MALLFQCAALLFTVLVLNPRVGHLTPELFVGFGVPLLLLLRLADRLLDGLAQPKRPMGEGRGHAS